MTDRDILRCDVAPDGTKIRTKADYDQMAARERLRRELERSAWEAARDAKEAARAVRP